MAIQPVRTPPRAIPPAHSAIHSQATRAATSTTDILEQPLDARGLLPPRLPLESHPHSRYEPIAQILLTCLKVLTWPVSQLKRLLRTASNRQRNAEALQSSLNAVRQELGAVQSHPGLTAEVHALRREKDQCQSEVQTLQAQIAALNPVLEQARQKAAELAGLERRINEMTRQVDVIRQQTQSLQRERDAAREEKTQLDALIAQARDNAPELVASIISTDQELTRLRSLDAEARADRPYLIHWNIIGPVLVNHRRAADDAATLLGAVVAIGSSTTDFERAGQLRAIALGLNEIFSRLR